MGTAISRTARVRELLDSFMGPPHARHTSLFPSREFETISRPFGSRFDVGTERQPRLVAGASHVLATDATILRRPRMLYGSRAYGLALNLGRSGILR